MGDTFPGPTVGVIDYSFNNFKLQVISLPALVSGGLTQEVAPAAGPSQLSAAAFNVENLAPGDPPGKFSALAKLIVNPTASNRREIILTRTTILTIGRDPSNDLVLPDAMVSRRHAVIESRGRQFFLRDCNSANGSVVNGNRVSEQGLRDGDLVAIGSMRLLFREEVIEAGGGKVLAHPSAAPLECPACKAPYRRGDLFCRECGAQVAQPSGPPKTVCAACGARCKRCTPGPRPS